MNDRDTKRYSDTVSSAASMTLFLLFAVCCLVIISVAASAYGRINRNYDNVFNSAASVRYITNKIRAAETAEVLSDTELLLTNDGYSTMIYLDGGVIYERLFPTGTEPAAEGGEEMFRAETFSLTENGGIITVTASDGGDTFTARCSSGGKIQRLVGGTDYEQ